MSLARHPVIAVLGSGTEEYDRLARPLGEWLARQGFHLLTGGGAGVMRAVSRSFYAVQPRQGLVLGIIPGAVDAHHYRRRAGYPNEFVEVAIFTHLDLSGEEGMFLRSRNHVNVLSADVVIVLPGGHGTSTEAHLAVRYRRPTIVFTDGPIPPALPRDLRIGKSLMEVQEFVLGQAKNWLGQEIVLVDTKAPYASDIPAQQE